MSFKTTLKINWYPGHMRKALRSLQERCKGVDLVVEVRDARVPVTAENGLLDFGSVPRRTLLTHGDLVPPSPDRVSLQGPRGARKASKKVAEWVRQACPDAKTPPNVLVVGLPNAGKSSLINALRPGGAKAPVGRRPGLTRSVTGFRVDSDAGAYFMLDSPGQFPPDVKTVEAGLKLALVNAVPHARVPEGVLLDFLLHTLNDLDSGLGYQRAWGLSAPIRSLPELLSYLRGRYMLNDSHSAEAFVLRQYRNGKLGHYVLDVE